MSEKKKIGIAGIGNYILADEGFGVHVAHYLQNNYTFPDIVEIQDIGTAGILMAPFFEECDPVFVIDVVDIEGEPGSFHFFTINDVKAGNFQLRMSPHQLGLLEILEVSKLRGAIPGDIEFYTVIPKVLEEGIELSDELDACKVEVAEMILTRLTELGVEYSKKGGCLAGPAMHEISLVQGLFQQLKELAAENRATKIISVTMEIGPLCGVVLDSFQFGFDILSKDDEMLKSVQLIIEIPEVEYHCTECGNITRLAGPKPDECPRCGDLLLIPQGGEDLILLQVEME